MSFSCAKSLLGLSTSMLKQHGALSRSSKSVLTTGLCRVAHSQSQRTLTRSMWYLCRNPEHSPISTKKIVGVTKACGCCGLHTEGDKDIIEFLEDEIKYEKKSEQKNLPKVNGFELTKTDGPNVELTRRLDNEIVVVKFNVNNTVDDEAAMEFKESSQNAEDEESQMVSRPPFIVEFTKGGNQTLAIQCMFPMDKFTGAEQTEVPEGEYDDLIEIEDVALLEKGKKWEDASYTVTGANMDGNLYAMLLNMMDERGITADFIKELVDFSTTYEHKQYLSFLTSLQGFVSK